MINLDMDNVQAWYEKVKNAGCKIVHEAIRTPFATEENPVYVYTWLDPEGTFGNLWVIRHNLLYCKDYNNFNFTLLSL